MSNVFTQPNSVEYMRYITLNLGYGGLFTLQTPRNYIEGYTDMRLETLANTPVFMGGDMTVNPMLSLNNRPTSPANNPISFFTGVGAEDLTRTMQMWYGSTNVTVQGKAYETTTTVVDLPYNPWTTD